MAEGKKKTTSPSGLQASFVTGAIALVFLIIGYETALFVHKAAVLHIAARRDIPDTVFVYVPAGDVPAPTGMPADAPPSSSRPGSVRSIRKSASHSPAVQAVRAATRRVESFRFNPNTVSLEDLQRLGFSEKQAQAIDHYRQKGGRFRRREDFARSYVVADSVYQRLAPYIDIPKLDINKADSTALLDLPGIGPWFAGAILRYRSRLKGFSTVDQLLEIKRLDEERLAGFRDLVICSAPSPYPLWTLGEAELAEHPYLSKAEAHGVVLYREHNRREDCTLEGLQKAGVLSEEHAGQWKRCRIAAP